MVEQARGERLEARGILGLRNRATGETASGRADSSLAVSPFGADV